MEQEAPAVIYKCKHCKVEVLSKTDHRAVLGKVHKKCCPRRRILG